ncbi:MAG: hypothetical protein EOO86_00300 [Pedobacter sp.]|nr:MAG: hypothetical protein EOO86_00300 [Pedobacter sp.]
MSRIFIIFCFSLCLLSCTKEKLLRQDNEKTGSIAPKGRFQTYGLTATGLADDTKGLQKLVNDSSVIYLHAGIYLISETISLPAGVQLIGQEGTIIVASREMRNTLLYNGRFLSAIEGDDVLIKNIHFKSESVDFQFSEWNNACIFILNSRNVVVEDCLFDFKFPYSSIGMEAVWVSGSQSKNNIIRNNDIHSLGIKYAENGADFTIVEENTITNSYSNAITGNGNKKGDEVLGSQIKKNVILNAGRMGIEDWGNTDGTVIDGNRLEGTGVDPSQAHDGIGISAVGVNVLIKNNQVTDSKIYAIEARGNYGIEVSNNILKNSSSATGIILNFTFAQPKINLNAANVHKNLIENCEKGIHVFGDYQARIFIENNVLRDIISKAISLESGAQEYEVRILNNQFFFDKKTEADRFAFFSYTKFKPGEAKQMVFAADNSIEYAVSAAGGPGMDFGFVIRTDHMTVNNLFVQGNNNRNSANHPILALSDLGGKPDRCNFTSNKVYGAIVETAGFTNLVQNDVVITP